jgi:hypothetical protein
MTGPEIVVQIALAIIALAAADFIYRYARFSPWRSTLQGWMLMAQKVTWLLFAIYWFFDPLWAWVNDTATGIYLVVLAVCFIGYDVGLHLVQGAARPVKKKYGAGFVQKENLEQTQNPITRGNRPRKEKEQ